MPTVSMFCGITIRMYSPDHNPPHFHAFYQGYEAMFDFAGNLMKGRMPQKQTKLVVAWAILRENQLTKNWKLIEEGKQVEEIEPLR